MRRTYWMSVEQVATIVTALMLASCVRVHAQFGVEQPFFFRQGEVISGGYTGTVQSLPGLVQYWVRTNGITTDAPEHTPARITNWTALVGNNRFQKANATYTKWPSNSSDNVAFDGWNEGNYLTNGGITLTNFTVGLIFKPRRYTGGSLNQLISTENSAQSAIGLGASTNLILSTRNYGGTAVDCNAGYIGSVLSDVIVAYSNSVSGGGYEVYVNGSFVTNKVSVSLTNINNNWLEIGYNGTTYYDGWHYELAFFTNLFTSLNASNFHHYRTNVYGGSP